MVQIKFKEKFLNFSLFLQLPLNKKKQDTQILLNFTRSINFLLLFSFNFYRLLIIIIIPLHIFHSFLLTKLKNLPILNFLNH